MKLHADDVGYDTQINEQILKLIKTGNLSSLSILSNWSHTVKICQKLAKYKNIDVFLHFNLIEGKSILGKQVSSLVDNQTGEYFNRNTLIIKILLRQIDKNQIKNELLAQMLSLEKIGLKLAGIDSHQHLHALSPVAEMVDEVAVLYNIKQVRSFSQMRTVTGKGRLKYHFLKIVAKLSYFIYYGKVGLPVSWRRKKWKDFCVASWEKVDVNKLQKKEILVFHPGLNFDR